MKNEFDRELLQKWFFYNYNCWWCGRNTADSYHHVTGRDSSSILNSAPLCNESCHLAIHGKLKKKENIRLLLEKTMEYLLRQGYKFDDNDKDFISKNIIYYEEILEKHKGCLT
jgi:hypothetical protein